jgi:hypothetical protein
MQPMSSDTTTAIFRAARNWRDRPELRVSSDPADVESVTIRYLMYVLMPAWFVPGVVDYLLHRRTWIETRWCWRWPQPPPGYTRRRRSGTCEPPWTAAAR